MTGGNTRARAVEHNAPINEMNKLSLGTNSAIKTGDGHKKEKLNSELNLQFKGLTCKKHHRCSE
jgi:hypothetical protein